LSHGSAQRLPRYSERPGICGSDPAAGVSVLVPAASCAIAAVRSQPGRAVSGVAVSGADRQYVGKRLVRAQQYLCRVIPCGLLSVAARERVSPAGAPRQGFSRLVLIQAVLFGPETNSTSFQRMKPGT